MKLSNADKIAGGVLVGLLAYGAYHNKDMALSQFESEPTIPTELSVQTETSATFTHEPELHVDKNIFDFNETFTMEIDGITYSWPVGRPHRSLFEEPEFDLPCTTYTGCHWDTTPAIDFLYTDAGENNRYNPLKAMGSDGIVNEPVRAIVDETIIHTKPYKDTGCYSLKLAGIDGFDYWYGHINQPNVVPEQTVEAGEQLATVGDIECVGNENIASAVAHTHIDAVRSGNDTSNKANREFQLINIANILFTNMPE